MRKNKNRMQHKVLSNTIKQLKAREDSVKLIHDDTVRLLEHQKDKYKQRIEFACKCIVSELESNDLLAAIFSEAKLIEYNGPDHLKVEKREHRFDCLVSIGSQVCEKTFDYEFMYKFSELIQDHREQMNFGKIYEVEHNGKRQCLFLTDQAMKNIPVDYLIVNHMKDIANGLKRQL